MSKGKSQLIIRQTAGLQRIFRTPLPVFLEVIDLDTSNGNVIMES